MARTQRRARALRELLIAAGLRPSLEKPRRPSGDRAWDELLSLYHDLGGTQAEPRFKPGAWDLTFERSLFVELDEELHFNRYRAKTLAASWACSLPWCESYLEYCARHEDDCLKGGCWGSRWTTPSSARMFPGGPVGDLSGDGAPRWKQRALYDGVKDLAPVESAGVVMARLSVYDRIGSHTLGAILDGRAPAKVGVVRKFAASRFAGSLRGAAGGRLFGT